MAQAQAIKDATMGWFIAPEPEEGRADDFFHFNGTYHSDGNNGIIPYLKEYRPKTTVAPSERYARKKLTR